MKITALIENTSACGLPAEHGLSLFVEARGRRFLFDMGQSAEFARNAEKLGIDLNTADFAVLSHGHYDHGGGISAFLHLNDHAPVYMNRHAFEPHYNGTEKYIGLDVSLRDSDRVILTDGDTKIEDGFTLHTCNNAPKIVDFGSFGLNMRVTDKLVPDDFRHEHYLLVEENGKRVLFSGCSHRGILNIMHWFQPDALIGGFHFSKLPLDKTLSEYAGTLDSWPTAYYTGHCTGTAQYEYMKKYMRNLHYLSTGECVVL